MICAVRQKRKDEMDWNALLIALIIFPIIWGFSAALRTRAYLLIGLSILFLATSLGGCVVAMRNWKIALPEPPTAMLGRNLFVLGFLLSLAVSIIAIVRERRERQLSGQKKRDENAEPTPGGDSSTRADAGLGTPQE